MSRQSLTYPQTPSITPSYAYADGKAIGGLLKFKRLFRAELSRVVIKDNAKVEKTLDLALFSRAFTPTADKSDFTIQAADKPYFLGFVRLSIYIPGGSLSIAETYENKIVLPSGGLIYGQLVARESATYAADNDLRVEITTLEL